MSILEQLPCNLPIANYICATTKRIENRSCPIKAVVIVPLGTSYASYIPQVTFPYINENFSQIPISVHYAISQKGELAQFVGTQDTAFGVRDYNSPSYPFVTVPTPSTKDGLNCPYIFIGVEIPFANNIAVELCPTKFELSQFQKHVLAKLICCVTNLYGLTPSTATIIDGYALDTRLDSFFLPTDLIAQVIEASENNCWNDNPLLLCTDNGNGSPVDPNPTDPDCPDCEDDTCCPLHKARIAVVENTINNLNNTIATLQTQVTAQTNAISAVNQQVTDIVNHYLQIIAKFDQIEDCFNCLCPQQSQLQRIEYELSGSENAQSLLPLAPTLLKLPIQISDSNPAVANSSSYFIAQLDTACNYVVQLALTLEYSEYFAGGEVWVDMVSCSGRQRIATQSMAGDGVASLFGQVALSPTSNPCNVWFEVFTNDNKDGARTIEYANVKIQCS